MCVFGTKKQRKSCLLRPRKEENLIFDVLKTTSTANRRLEQQPLQQQREQDGIFFCDRIRQFHRVVIATKPLTTKPLRKIHGHYPIVFWPLNGQQPRVLCFPNVLQDTLWRFFIAHCEDYSQVQKVIRGNSI